MAAVTRCGAEVDCWIASDSAIQGGAPVIKGTRITVYSVLGRISGGDSIDEIAEENPDVPHEAFEAALIFAKGNSMGVPRRD